jgi:hypothetical protein
MNTTHKTLENFNSLFEQDRVQPLMAWIDSASTEELPIAYNKLAAHIFHTCGQIDDIERMYFQIEKFDAIIHHAITMLIQLYMAQGELLSKQNEDIANACKKLLKVQYRAYSIQLEYARKNADKKQLLATSIHRIMIIQLYLHMISYIMYNAIADKEWLNLHRLYIIAEQNNLSNFSVKNKYSYIQKTISISDLYTHALLMGCARLHTLNVSSILKALDFVFERAKLVCISRCSNGKDNEIAVDIATGSAPNFRKFHIETSQSDFRYLYLNKLLESMKNIVVSNNVFNRCNLTEELKTHLVRAWGKHYTREKRVTVDKNIELTIGFSNLHYYLCGGKELKGFLGEQAELSIVYEEDELISVIEQQRSSDIWSPSISGPAGELIHVELPETLAFQRYFELNENININTHPKMSVRMIDQSLHGCCLELPKETIQHLTINDLVGFRDPQMNSHWQVGEITWFKIINDKVIQMGVRILGTESIPLAIDIPLHHGVHKNYTKGILLPFENTLKLCTGILTEETIFEEGECLKVAQKGLGKDMKLTSRIHQKERYTHFYCGFYVPI